MVVVEKRSTQSVVARNAMPPPGDTDGAGGSEEAGEAPHSVVVLPATSEAVERDQSHSNLSSTLRPLGDLSCRWWRESVASEVTRMELWVYPPPSAANPCVAACFPRILLCFLSKYFFPRGHFLSTHLLTKSKIQLTTSGHRQVEVSYETRKPTANSLSPKPSSLSVNEPFCQ